MERYVTDVELSKKLKEAGVTQKSIWWWVKMSDGWKLNITDMPNHENIAAFTVGELGDMLPNSILIKKEGGGAWAYLVYTKNGKKWWIHYQARPEKSTADSPIFSAETEAQARGEMLLWLVKKGYVKAEELG